MKTTKAPKTWTDHTGLEIPVSRISKLEKLKERNAKKLMNAVSKCKTQLKATKELAVELTNDIYKMFLEDNGLTELDRKGNFSWFSFDRTFKIELKSNAQIVFDDLEIEACKSKLMTFIDNHIAATDPKDQFIKQIVLSAFETSRGKLDYKKVLSLKSYKDKVKNKRFDEALEHLDKASKVVGSKEYMLFYVLGENKKYQPISLNISSF